MNEKYILSCCSTADLTEDHFKNIDVEYIYVFTMNLTEYLIGMIWEKV